MEKGIRDRNGNLKYGRVPLLQLKNPMTLCLTRMRVHLERRTVAARPREILSPLSSFVANGSLSLSLPSPPLFLSAFVVENLLEGRLRMSSVYLRDYAPVPRRYSHSFVQRPFPSFCRRYVLTDFHRFEIAREQETGASEVLTHNASIKVKRRAYVQRTVLLNRERSTVASSKRRLKMY